MKLISLKKFFFLIKNLYLSILVDIYNDLLTQLVIQPVNTQKIPNKTMNQTIFCKTSYLDRHCFFSISEIRNLFYLSKIDAILKLNCLYINYLLKLCSISCFLSYK